MRGYGPRLHNVCCTYIYWLKYIYIYMRVEGSVMPLLRSMYVGKCSSSSSSAPYELINLWPIDTSRKWFDGGLESKIYNLCAKLNNGCFEIRDAIFNGFFFIVSEFPRPGSTKTYFNCEKKPRNNNKNPYTQTNFLVH